MSDKKLGQEGAFACVDSQKQYLQEGISKRLYIACAAMQGILSSGRVSTDSDSIWITKRSYQIADELLRQENL